MDKREYEIALAKKIATFKHDPLGYIKFAFPWRKEGTPLEEYDGPDTWQNTMLTDISKRQLENPEETLQYAISSGH